MIVTKISEEKDGQVEVSLAMTKDQAVYLMNVGLGILLAHGAATVKEMTRAQFDEEQQTLEASAAATETGVPSPATASKEEMKHENTVS